MLAYSKDFALSLSVHFFSSLFSPTFFLYSGVLVLDGGSAGLVKVQTTGSELCPDVFFLLFK